MLSQRNGRNGGLLTAEQAAQILGVPHTWVLREARSDRIQHLRLGRYVRFEEDALRTWWASRRRGPQPERTATS
jgi:excisionase family DNA binding protein